MHIFIHFIIALFFANHTFSKDLYYSKEYEVKFSSENINLKKEENLNTIINESFKKLINQLLTNKEYNKLSKILTNDFVNTFLFSLDISEEKINNNNYSSKVRIAFDNSKLINYFINNNINFISYDPENFLIIIFDQKLSSENLLSNDNRFYKYE